MNIRYTLTPQMKEYDRIGQKWIPYLMYFHTPNYSSSVLNTDSKGFRVAYKGSERIADFNGTERFSTCLLIGGSCAFGIGATNDKETIPSILNSVTDYLWLNFGGRAFGSTQELLLFLFYHQQVKNIKKIVILSGLNNLILYYLTKNYPKELGSFFFFNLYNQKMNIGTMSLKRRATEMMSGSIFQKKVVKNRYKTPFNMGNKEDLLYVIRRDISNWKLLAESLGIELYYVLQPIASWVNKELSKEENMLFAELDSYPQSHWKILKNNMGRDQYSWYLNNLEEICKSNNVHFFDMNNALSKMELGGKWIYVDRAHLTDEGNRIVAEVLKKGIIGR